MLFTNDVETTSIVNNSLNPKTGERVLKEGMPLLLELYNKYNIKATFFFNGDIVKLFPDVVRMILPYGHEVASHGLTHEVEKAFDLLTLNEQIEHLSKSKKMLEDISGTKVVSFRAPALRVNEFTVEALEKTGFLIDSSIASQRFDMFMSFGSLKKLNRFFAPRLPYRTAKNNLAKRGDSGITEIPISAFLLPYIGTTLRIFPHITSLLGRLLSIESRITGKPINFLTHPNEFIIEEKESRTVIRRSKNLINYLLGDILRNKLKLNNLGKQAIPLLEKEILFFKKHGYSFYTLRDYLGNK
jgi:peptidoglycan/xylan/chitin deacetylase (PgdA/CDA1 family)